MRFRYRLIISLDSETGLPFRLMRPEIPVTVIGARDQVTYSALVDTGADDVVFPRSVADELGIALSQTKRSQATGFGGGTVPLLSGLVTIEIGDADSRLRWTTRVMFSDCEPLQDEVSRAWPSWFLGVFRGQVRWPRRLAGTQCRTTLTSRDN